MIRQLQAPGLRAERRCALHVSVRDRPPAARIRKRWFRPTKPMRVWLHGARSSGTGVRNHMHIMRSSAKCYQTVLPGSDSGPVLFAETTYISQIQKSARISADTAHKQDTSLENSSAEELCRTQIADLEERSGSHLNEHNT